MDDKIQNSDSERMQIGSKANTNVICGQCQKEVLGKEAYAYKDVKNNEIFLCEPCRNEAEKVLNTSEIKAAMRELPEMSGKVFNLFAIDGFSHKEVSEMLGMSEGTSKWHVNFARNKLKELLSLKLDKKSLKTILAAAVSVILIIIEKTII